MSAVVDSAAVAALRRIGAMTLFLGQVLARVIPAFAKPGLIVKQIYNAGARSLVIIMLSGLFVAGLTVPALFPLEIAFDGGLLDVVDANPSKLSGEAFRTGIGPGFAPAGNRFR